MDAAMKDIKIRQPALPAIYLVTNLVSACAIVFANKAVLSIVHFRFTVALTCFHTVATWLVASACSTTGIIQKKALPRRAVVSLAAAFAGYIVLCNVSLQLNTVGFYQLTKIAIAPTMLLMESAARRQAPSTGIAVCVGVVCVGVGLATISDAQVMTNLPGLVLGILSVVVSAQYGMWIGNMTKQHGVTPMQLLHQYLPYASLLMAVCVPLEGAMIGKSFARASSSAAQSAAGAAGGSGTGAGLAAMSRQSKL